MAVSKKTTYVVRLDVLGRVPAAARETNRRSLAYLGHFSDMHVMDAQSPARLEPPAERAVPREEPEERERGLVAPVRIVDHQR